MVRKKILCRGLFVIIGIFFIIRFSYSANLIAKEDFEDQNFADFFHAMYPHYWDNIAIVSYEPHSGSYSLRGNACSSCIDPITGLQGRNRTDLNFGYCPECALGTSFNLDEAHNEELYIRFWLKYDKNFDPTDGYSSNKVWWMQFESDTNTYFVQFRGTSLSYYDESGGGEHYFSISPNAVDGKWHLWEIYVKYNDYGSNNGILKIWFDSELKVDISNALLRVQPGGKISRMCFGYFHNNATTSSGWQIDDIEIWDGIPDSKSGPIVSEYVPSPNATNVPQNTNISFDITDSDGVNQPSILVTVNGTNVTQNCTITTISNGFHILYDPPQDFNYGQIVTVSVSASDTQGNTTNDSWSFTIQQQQQANVPSSPTITEISD